MLGTARNCNRTVVNNCVTGFHDFQHIPCPVDRDSRQKQYRSLSGLSLVCIRDVLHRAADQGILAKMRELRFRSQIQCSDSLDVSLSEVSIS
jgi:hypothetical protein